MSNFEKQFIRMIVDARIRCEKCDSAYDEWCALFDILRDVGDRRMSNNYYDALLEKRLELEAEYRSIV